MLVTNRGIIIIMINPQKTVFLINKSCIYEKKKRKKKKQYRYVITVRVI